MVFVDPLHHVLLLVSFYHAYIFGVYVFWLSIVLDCL